MPLLDPVVEPGDTQTLFKHAPDAHPEPEAQEAPSLRFTLGAREGSAEVDGFAALPGRGFGISCADGLDLGERAGGGLAEIGRAHV